jgi:hypothetical protein
MTFVTLKTRASTTMGMNLQCGVTNTINGRDESFLTHDRLNLSRDTKKRPSQRAGNTYNAVQNNLKGIMNSL